MFGRGKKRSDQALASGTTPLRATIDDVIAAKLPNQPVSAREAIGCADDVARRYAKDARLFLVLSDEVNTNGLAPNWQFHYMFPVMHAEGVFTVRTGAHSTTGRAELHVLLTPVPVPGSSEHQMVRTGGPYMSLVMEQKWQERLERIIALPTDFHDSSEAVLSMSSLGHDPFSGGTLRMKARTLPDRKSVWETVTPNGVVQTPFGPW